MFRRLFLIGIFALAALVTHPTVSKASAISTTVSLTCKSVTVSGAFTSSGDIDIDIDDITTGDRIVDDDEVSTPLSPFTRNLNFYNKFAPGDKIEIEIWADDSLDYFTTIPACEGPGPTVPAGFVLRTIKCDVAVFDMPNGRPLNTGERIRNGQTWYVNPKSAHVSSNSRYPDWTEIFVSGPIDGYIPTACVGAAPAGY